MPDGSPQIPVDKLFYTPEQATIPLEMGLDAVESWMASGHLKYTAEKERGKRRIYRDDLFDFAKWYREKYLACPSTSHEIKPGTRKARSGNTTSNVVALDFADRSTAATAGQSCALTDPRKKRNARKRSLDLNQQRSPQNDRG